MDKKLFQSRFEELKKIYEAGLPGKIIKIKSEWASYLLGGSESHRYLAEMRFQVHKMAGSGATFGYRKTSDIAEHLELLIKLLLESREHPSQTQKDQIQSHLINLVMSFGTPPKKDVQTNHKDERIPLGSDILFSLAENKLLFITEDDVEYGQLLTTSLSQHGYEVEHFLNGIDLENKLSSQRPAAILMDMMLPEGEFAGAEVIRRVNNGEQKPIPVIFMSVRKDLESRLQAVRAGATHYFVKPFNYEKLLNALDEVSGNLPQNPYRVLIVDDDEELTALYSLTLQEAGMRVVVENDPMQALARLEEFKPDLILLDVLMPRCGGLELAMVIRQFEAYDLIPIIFLTTEWRSDIKLAALNLGSDDFLNKPIPPWQLVSTLKARIKRLRKLQAVVLNHHKK